MRRLICLLTLLVNVGYGMPITTPEIVARTSSASLACMRWQVVGLCLWLNCGLGGCRIDTSLKIGHYNPDLVVSSYNGLGENPWQEIRATLGLAQAVAAQSVLGALTDLPIDSAGNRTEGRNDRDHANLIFRETDAIGHPGFGLLPDPLAVAIRCQSDARRFVPYFQSAIDALSWRSGLPDSLLSASLAPGLREVGAWPRATWGGVYPRTGWAIQAEEPKAAALTAQRAGDIVTRRFQPHLYIGVEPVPSPLQRVWSPPPLVETDASSGTWQMLSPVVDADCAVFGLEDTLINSWANGRLDVEGDYVWNLWRPYQCCLRRGEVFLGDINWTEFPP